MQSSIKSFFQRKTPLGLHSIPSNAEDVPGQRSARLSTELAHSSPKQKLKCDDAVIVLSDTEPENVKKRPSVKKRRRLGLPEDSSGSNLPEKQKQFEKAQAGNSNGMATISEKVITSYVSRHGQLLKRVIQSRSLDELKKMLIDTLVVSKKSNQLWTKQFQNHRCLNQDVDDLICSWMRIFIRRRPLNINDDEIALLEDYRVRSAIEQKRDSKFIVNDSEDEEIPLCRVLVLEGPIGSGKTSAVHSCLYVLNEDRNGVIEVNASQSRRQSDLVNRFKEATQSQWIGDKPSELRNPELKGHGKARRKKKSRQAGSISDKHAVILIDDVDIILEDDAGFSKGIAYLLKDTRRPIILTCVNLPNSIRSLLSNGYYNFNLLEQNQKSMVSFLLSITISQGAVALPSDIDLRRCLNLLHNDLRSAMNHLQFWLDVDQESLITTLRNDEEIDCRNAPDIYFYQRFAGFGGLSLEPIFKSDRCSNLQSVVWHGTESELCNIIHENYIKLCCEMDDDPRNIQTATDLADVAESLSIVDLISAYRSSRQELALHDRLICCTSGLLCEFYKGFVCNSSRDIDVSECVLHSSIKDADHHQIISIWEEHQYSEPVSKHLPSCTSFAIDHMSAIRSILRHEEQRKLQSNRRTRRFQNYLKNSLTAKGLEVAENYCASLSTEACY